MAHRGSRGTARRGGNGLVLVFVLLLSGCTGQAPQAADDDLPTELPPEAPDSARGHLPPEWDPGFWWQYRNLDGEAAYFVAASDTRTEWMMRTDGVTVSFFDARTDVSTLGPQRKPDLAGSQGDDWVEFFRWPMQGNMSWTTRWDGAERAITNTDAGDGVFTFEARNVDGTLHASYAYDIAVRWFTELNFHGPDGSVVFAWELVDHGANYTGTLRSWDLTSYWSDEAGPSSPAVLRNNVGQNFEVAADVAEIWVQSEVDCVTGRFGLGIMPAGPDGPDARVGHETACPASGDTQETVQAAVPGTWVVHLDAVLDETGSFRAEALGRTLIEEAYP